MKLALRTGPQEYQCKENAFEELEEHLTKRNIRKVLLLHGEKSFHASEKYLENFYQSAIKIVKVRFAGECSEEESQRICEIACNESVDAIIGLGGGKIMDTAKTAASKTKGMKIVLLPTLASNCASWSPMCVIYSPEGNYRHSIIFPQQVSLVLVEPRLLIESPLPYFVAGIADTLAKWYESDPILSVPENREKVPLILAHHVAYECRKTILENAAQAVSDMQNQQLTSTFIRLAETIIVTAGLLGGLADDYGRTSGAHSIHNAITSRSETHHLLHGEKVAYGILWQLAIEEKWEEIKILLPFYRQLRLPSSLRELRLSHLDNAEWYEVIELVVDPSATIHLLPVPITKEGTYTALVELEELVANLQGQER